MAATFCPPSTPKYDFVSVSSGSAGTIQLPMVEAPRGRVTVPPAATVFSLSNTAGIGTEWDGSASKSTYDVTCDTNVTCELTAHYTSLTFRNEEGLFFPERFTHTPSG